MANAANRARRRPAPKAPTKNQLDYIKDLVERKGAEGAALHRQALANGNLTASSASLLIRALRDLPDVNKIPYRGPRKGKPASGSNDHVPLGIHRGVTLVADALLGIDDDLAFDQETGEVLTDHVGEPEAFPEDPPPPPTARKRGRTAIKEGGLLAQRFGN